MGWVSIIATAGQHTHGVIRVDPHGEHDRAAAHLTVLDVILFSRRVIDQHAYAFATVGATEMLFALLHGGGASVAEIGELKWQAEFGVLDQRDHGLQVVTILAGHAQLVLLHLSLNLELAVLDELGQ